MMSEKEPSVLGDPPMDGQARGDGEEAAVAATSDAHGDATASADTDAPQADAADAADADEGSSDGVTDAQEPPHVSVDGDAAADDDAESAPVAEIDDAAETIPTPAIDVIASPSADATPAPAVAARAASAGAPSAESPVRARKRRSAPTFYVAGFWRRIGAAFVDLGIVLPISALLVLVVSKLAGLSLPPGRHRGLDFWLDLLLANDPAVMGGLGLTLAIGLVYVLVFQIVLGHTLGMRALKIRIIDVYGDRVSTGRSIARTAGYVGCLATLSLGFLWIGFDAEKRGLHDWVSGTYVVKA